MLSCFNNDQRPRRSQGRPLLWPLLRPLLWPLLRPERHHPNKPHSDSLTLQDNRRREETKGASANRLIFLRYKPHSGLTLNDSLRSTIQDKEWMWCESLAPPQVTLIFTLWSRRQLSWSETAELLESNGPCGDLQHKQLCLHFTSHWNTLCLFHRLTHTMRFVEPQSF